MRDCACWMSSVVGAAFWSISLREFRSVAGASFGLFSGKTSDRTRNIRARRSLESKYLELTLVQ